ncbi:MAG: 2,4-dihydroxyhept-2-ene-1,7-dioic acid aldolase (EC, partial [uncultured Rubrobacteraceae bacterium]
AGEQGQVHLEERGRGPQRLAARAEPLRGRDDGPLGLRQPHHRPAARAVRHGGRHTHAPGYLYDGRRAVRAGQLERPGYDHEAVGRRLLRRHLSHDRGQGGRRGLCRGVPLPAGGLPELRAVPGQPLRWPGLRLGRQRDRRDDGDDRDQRGPRRPRRHPRRPRPRRHLRRAVRPRAGPRARARHGPRGARDGRGHRPHRRLGAGEGSRGRHLYRLDGVRGAHDRRRIQLRQRLLGRPPHGRGGLGRGLGSQREGFSPV